MPKIVGKGTRSQLFRNMGRAKPRRLPMTGNVGKNLKQKIRRSYTISGILGFGRK